jgi:hypothetical protein
LRCVVGFASTGNWYILYVAEDQKKGMIFLNSVFQCRDERATHIEVCARVRPLQISMQSSSSYFGGGNSSPLAADTTITSPRKPPVPSRIGKGVSNIPSLKKKSSSDKDKEKPQSKVAAAVAAAEADLFYAWDVTSNDTAAQSPRTDIVPGRTHQYTLDQIYGPSCNTRQVYQQSVKPLVLAAMEGANFFP